MPKAADVARRVYASLQDGRAPGGRARLLAVGKRAGDLSVAAGQGDLAGRIFEEIGLARDASLAYERAGLTAKAAEQSVKVADYERALALFRKAGIPVPRQVQAGYLEMTAQYADAARVYEECEELERAAALYEREGLLGDAARVLEAMQDHLRAAECYEAAGEPRRAGQLFQKAGLYDKAADCLERAGDLERAAYVYLLAEDFLAAADAFLKAGKSDDAVALLQKIKPGHEDYLEGCLRLGQIFFEKGLFSLALDKYHKGPVDRLADETLFPSFYNLGLTYENLERYREARECYEKILSVDFATGRDRGARTFVVRRV
ncbi:MAG: tetratricopeptide repeat protein [Acidobacteriota bacterium]